LRYAFTIHYIEFSLLKRGRHLVFDDTCSGSVSYNFLPVLNGACPPDIDPYRCVKLESIRLKM